MENKVTDYLSLEKSFRLFRKEIINYRDLLIRYYGKTAFNAIVMSGKIPPAILNKMDLLKSKLSQKYGVLAANIHGMGGYVELPHGGKQIDIFMTAFFPISTGNYDFTHWAISASIQCLDKAIGSCQYARSNEIERKGNQICIHRGAIIPGFLEILNIFKEARKNIFIRDRYISAELISMIDTLSRIISVKMLIQREKYQDKPSLKLVYDKYRQQNNNVEIRDIPKSMFHSRKIVIDEQRSYELTFSIKDVGICEGTIFILNEKNTNTSITEFKSDWNSGTPI